jgi:phage terminase large subunit-like protein
MRRRNQPASRTRLAAAAPIPAWDLYVSGVLAGEIPANNLIKLACQRHLNDLQHGAERGIYFDVDAAARSNLFFKVLQHSKGEWAGQPFDLDLWQAFIDAMLFGWKRVDGTRRFREAYIAVPRKNGKTTLLSGEALKLLAADGEAGAEVYIFARTKDQAKLMFDESVQMRNASPRLTKRVGLVKNNLYILLTNSRLMPLSADDETHHGLNASGGLADELHVHPSRDLWDVIATSQAARRQPLMIGITTHGWDRQSFCYAQYEYARKVLEGILQDDRFFAFVAMLDDGADWQDEREWQKCNPNFGKSVKVEYLREQATRAKNDPTALNAFLRLHLNCWTQQDERVILPQKWAACAGVAATEDPVMVRARWLQELRGKTAIAALDLSTKLDLSTDVLLFPKQPGLTKPRVLPFFFCPEQAIEERSKRDRVHYQVWARQGFLLPTPGNVVDYDFIRETHRKLANEYQIQETAFDPWNATQISTQLQGDGMVMWEHQQGFRSMSDPTKELLKMIEAAEFEHGNNPVLTWMADNLVVSQDPAGNLKPDKARAREKIDGIVALVMCISRMMATPEGNGGGVTVFGDCAKCGDLCEGKLVDDRIVFDCGVHS